MDDELSAAPLRLARLEEALAILDAASRESQPLAEDAPVFIASIGWRSGSTLMQRLLMTDPSILVWGEPMSHADFVSRLAEPLFGIDGGWPEPQHWISHRADLDRTRDWVATLAPDAGHLRAAYRAFFDTWLGVPARQRGFARWGVKQVRWTGADGLMLRWLYPGCRFVVIVRHPVSAFLSMRNFGFDPPSHGHIVRWPDEWIVTIDDYARFWNRLALSWHFASAKLGVQWVRYEDLADGRTNFGALGDTLGLALKPEMALSARAGGSDYRLSMTAEERDRINLLTTAGRRNLFYQE